MQQQNKNNEGCVKTSSRIPKTTLSQHQDYFQDNFKDHLNSRQLSSTQLGTTLLKSCSFSFNRNRIFQNGIPIRFNRIRIFHFSVPFKRKRIQYFNRIIRLNRISNYLTEFGPNSSVQPNIRSFSQIKRN